MTPGSVTPALLHSRCTAPNRSPLAAANASTAAQLRDIRRDGENLRACLRRERRGGAVEACGIDIRHHDAHALGRKTLAEREADPHWPRP